MPSFEMTGYPRGDILDVYSERDSIERSPVYQRISGVWDLRKRQLFIDSIINGVDLPKIYFHELLPPRREDGKLIRYAIIDGKQRLETIWSFMEDQFSLRQTFRLFEDPEVGGAGARYSALAKEYPLLRARFDQTTLPIVTVRTDDLELVEELFSRLNEAVPLTAPEYRNTLGGPLPRVFRELVTEDFFDFNVPFPTGRHRYLDLAAKFLYVMKEDGFVSTKKDSLDQMVIDFRHGRERSLAWAASGVVRELQEDTKSVLSRMHSFFRKPDVLLEGIGWITLYFHLFRLLRGHDTPRGLTITVLDRFLEALMNTRRTIRAITTGEEPPNAPHDPALTVFDSHRQSPNDASALRTRYTILRDYVGAQFDVVLPEPD